MGRKKIIYSEEEIKQRNRERQAKWRANHKDKQHECQAKWRAEHKIEINDYRAKYYAEHKSESHDYQVSYNKTPMGRARNLANNYKWNDKEANRGECTLTAKWIVDNIFTSKCHWCGETDWHKLGCDRIYNDKPHTPDNVNPCCEECNKKRGTKTYEEFLLEVDISH